MRSRSQLIFGLTISALAGGAQAQMSAHFFDVGQSDATLIEGPQGCNILVDAGRWDRSDVSDHIDSVGVDEIHLVIATHPHADHIGQLDDLIADYQIGEVWMSGYDYDSQTFSRTMDAIRQSGVGYREPRSGDSLNCGDLSLSLIHPVNPLEDVHDNLSVRIEYNQFSMLFTGDAEQPQENEMIERNPEVLDVDVYQLGHHGSYTSSSWDFLDAVDPQLGIYSAGRGNRYGHPHDAVVQRFDNNGIELVGTDHHGTITLTSDGHGFSVEKESVDSLLERNEGGDSGSFFGNRMNSSGNGSEQSSGGCIDLNSASEQRLQDITQIGPSRAEQIVDRRSERPYESLDELTDFWRVNDGTIDQIEDQGKACIN